MPRARRLGRSAALDGVAVDGDEDDGAVRAGIADPDGGGHGAGAVIEALPDAAGRVAAAGSARGLALVLLETLGGERAHDLVGLGAPAVGIVEPVHATILAQLVQPVRTVHVAPLHRGAGLSAIAPRAVRAGMCNLGASGAVSIADR